MKEGLPGKIIEGHLLLICRIKIKCVHALSRSTEINMRFMFYCKHAQAGQKRTKFTWGKNLAMC